MKLDGMAKSGLGSSYIITTPAGTYKEGATFTAEENTGTIVSAVVFLGGVAIALLSSNPGAIPVLQY